MAEVQKLLTHHERRVGLEQREPRAGRQRLVKHELKGQRVLVEKHAAAIGAETEDEKK